MLKIKNEATLSAIENFLKKSVKDESQNADFGFSEFSGVWSKDEAEEIERVIEESCETIHPDDWK